MKESDIIQVGNWARAELEFAEGQDAVTRVDTIRRVREVLNALGELPSR